MKTKLLLSGFLVASGLSFGQRMINFEDYYMGAAIYSPVNKLSDSDKSKLLTFRKNINASYKNSEAAPNPTYSAYINHSILAIETSSYDPNADFNIYSEPMLPDSIAKFSGSTADRNVTLHKLGMILDPTTLNLSTSQNFNLTEDLNLNKFQSYNLDSIFIPGVYSRVGNSTTDPEVDTLQIEITWAASSSTNTFELLTFSSGELSGESALGVKGSSSSSHGNKSFLSGTNKIVIKKYLTWADTSSFVQFFDTIVNQAIPAGNKVAVAYTFIPGKAYTSGDYSYQYTGGSTAPTMNSFLGIYWGFADQNNTELLYHDESSYAGSFVLGPDSRYGIYTGSDVWRNGLSFPLVAVGSNITFLISANVTGINELKSNGLKLWDNYPNPVREGTLINYELAETAMVSLSIYDITGKKVMNVEKGKQSAGTHFVELDVRNLQAGVYFYTLNAGQNSLTKKMTVVQ